MFKNVEKLAARFDLAGDFYADVVRSLLHAGTFHRDMRVLVVCGGPYDRDVLLQCGFRDVTISNLDSRMQGNEFTPFAWSFQDAERLSYADDTFDVTIVHNGLHHCYLPHRAVCEMYRVSRVGLLVFEPYDGPLSRLAVRTGLGQEYEVAAVFDNDMAFGGVGNTEIPNYVYRWTEDEVRKLVQSFAPIGRHRFGFYYAMRPPWMRLLLLKSKLALVATIAMLPLIKLGSVLFPKVSNNFAFVVLKPRIPEDLLPWLKVQDGAVKLNREWLRARYLKA